MVRESETGGCVRASDTERTEVQLFGRLVVVRRSALRDADRSVAVPGRQRGRTLPVDTQRLAVLPAIRPADRRLLHHAGLTPLLVEHSSNLLSARAVLKFGS